METELKMSQVISLVQLRRILVKAEAGELWVSVEGESKDYILRDGEELSIRKKGKVLVQALSDAKLRVSFVA